MPVRTEMQQMSHLPVFGVHVHHVFLVARHLYRIPSGDLDAVFVQPPYFHGIVCHEYQFPDPEICQDGSCRVILPEIRRKTEGEIGFHGIHPLVLEFVCPQFVYQSYSPAFLPHVDQDTASGLFYPPEGLCKLFPAVASQRAENIPGQTFGMYAAQHWFGSAYISFHYSQMMFPCIAVYIS